ncbi:MAG TPA: class I SAM-dependent methyltransferase [Candidatus Acidoferrum sp.]|nr:class I SAM-dependent methyltransferase [Candidatus Acidoferrum sp.]
MAQADSYEVLARHYDAAYAALKSLADVPFYVDLARRSVGPVLEIACGTGRVLLKIAREGIAIDGVDNSPAMLGVLKARLEREPREVRERVTLHAGDMRNFRIGKKYPLAIIPFRPMQHMYTVQDQVAALTNVAAHLEENGKLAFDVFYPKFELLAAGIGEEVPDLEWEEDPERRRVVRRFFRKESADKIHQIFAGTFIFRTYEGGKLALEETEPLKLSYYTYPQLQALFLLAGLEAVEEYGSFAKAPLDNAATEMIFVVRKRRV